MCFIGLPVILAYVVPLIASLWAILARPHLVLVVVTAGVTLFYSGVTVHFTLRSRDLAAQVAEYQPGSISVELAAGRRQAMDQKREGNAFLARHYAFCALIGLTGLVSQLIRGQIARVRGRAIRKSQIANP